MRNLQSYLNDRELLQQVEFALAEDIGAGDVTTNGVLWAQSRSAETISAVTAKLIAKSDGTLAGSELFELVFTTVAPETSCEFTAKDGTHFSAGETLATITGPASAILQAERTALNFIGRLCGVASLTAQYVSAVAHTNCKILDTRKTTPGWRALEKYAVNCGGGVNHRLGLYDMALIKENHIRTAGSIPQAIENVRSYLRETNKPEITIEVEIRNLAELKLALQASVNRVLLDNQSPAQLRELVMTARELSSETETSQTQLEASGNITLENVAAYAETGVDFISIGALTHSAKTSDLSLLIT